MPDWFTHSLVGWISGKTIKLDVSLVVIGSLLPDISKIYYVFNWFGLSSENFFYPIHTLIGALLVGCIAALFFKEFKKSFVFFSIGIGTHFILDLLLINVSGGIKLIFPFSWDEWSLQIIRADDYFITIYAVIASLIIYSVYFYYEKMKSKHKKNV